MGHAALAGTSQGLVADELRCKQHPHPFTPRYPMYPMWDLMLAQGQQWGRLAGGGVM